MPRESRVDRSNALGKENNISSVEKRGTPSRYGLLTRKAVGTSEPVRVEAMDKLRRQRREVPRPPDDLDSPPERTVRVQEPLVDEFALLLVPL